MTIKKVKRPEPKTFYFKVEQKTEKRVVEVPDRGIWGNKNKEEFDVIINTIYVSSEKDTGYEFYSFCEERFLGDHLAALEASEDTFIYVEGLEKSPWFCMVSEPWVPTSPPPSIIPPVGMTTINKGFVPKELGGTRLIKGDTNA